MIFTFDTAGRTHTGYVRSGNEDAHLAIPDHGLWVVADGMGGEAAGDYASRTIVHEIKTIGQPVSADDLLSRTRDRLIRAHRHLLDYARKKGARVVAATVVVLLAFDRYVACVWSGDSRLYRIRDGRLAQLNHDHNEVGELLARGAISHQEAVDWQGRNAVTRAVGVYDELETDILYGDLRDGDTFVLCSDGLTLHLADEDIKRLTDGAPVDEAADAMISLALERGGKDNVTVIVVRARSLPDEAGPFEPGWRPDQ